jgi:hypothetical protein
MARNIRFTLISFLILGMLCAPALAEADSDPGCWTFRILKGIIAVDTVHIVGEDIQEYSDTAGGSSFRYQEIQVSNAVNQVDVQFRVAGGPDTTVTIMRDYINSIAGMGKGAMIFADGGIQTYDVDAAVVTKEEWVRGINLEVKIYEHLKKRGSIHHYIGEKWPLGLWDPPVRYIWK